MGWKKYGWSKFGRTVVRLCVRRCHGRNLNGMGLSNVWFAKKVTKHCGNTLLRLVSFFANQTLLNLLVGTASAKLCSLQIATSPDLATMNCKALSYQRLEPLTLVPIPCKLLSAVEVSLSFPDSSIVSSKHKTKELPSIFDKVSLSWTFNTWWALYQFCLVSEVSSPILPMLPSRFDSAKVCCRLYSDNFQKVPFYLPF